MKIKNYKQEVRVQTRGKSSSIRSPFSFPLKVAIGVWQNMILNLIEAYFSRIKKSQPLKLPYMQGPPIWIHFSFSSLSVSPVFLSPCSSLLWLVSTKASRQSTLGYTHGSSLSADGAQATNLWWRKTLTRFLSRFDRRVGIIPTSCIWLYWIVLR